MVYHVSNGPKIDVIITSNRSPLKEYSDNEGIRSYYLQDNQEFEFCIHNPGNKDVLVSISIGDWDITNDDKLLVEAGKKIYIDCNMKSRKRLKYSFGAGSNSKNTNPLVRVEVFNKLYDIKPIQYQYYWPWQNPYYCQDQNVYYTNISMVGHVEETQTNTSLIIDETYSSSAVSFAMAPSYTIEFKLLPAKTDNVFRVYCVSCGFRRRKQSWRFCPKCGEKFLA